jgi:TPR repeat protein
MPGHAPSQYCLVFYEQGIGVFKELKKAEEWYAKAAAPGFAG